MFGSRPARSGMISSPLISPPGRDAARSNEEVDLQDQEGASARFCWRACVQPPPRGLARSPVAREVLQQALAARLELRLECGRVYARNGLVLATGGMRGRLSQQRPPSRPSRGSAGGCAIRRVKFTSADAWKWGQVQLPLMLVTWVKFIFLDLSKLDQVHVLLM